MKGSVAWIVVAALILAGCGADDEVQQQAKEKPSEPLPVAKITVKASADERRFIADAWCLDERECYGPNRFDRYAVAQYPDINTVKYRQPPEYRNDPDMAKAVRLDFRRGLFFAKQIQLADGQTLFDFLTRCSKTVSPLNYAEAAVDAERKSIYFGLQYFPVLKRLDTGEEIELNLIFDRRGDTIEARSPFFSTNVLKFPDFMARHGVTCWR